MPGSIVKASVVIDARAATVWRVFTDPVVTRRMGGEYVTGWKPGSAFGFKDASGKMLTRGAIVRIEKEVLLRHTLLDEKGRPFSTITYELDEAGGGTTLSGREEFVQAQSDEALADAKEGWAGALAQVKQLAEEEAQNERPLADEEVEAEPEDTSGVIVEIVPEDEAEDEAIVEDSEPRPPLPVLSPLLIADAVRLALAEDLGRAGDITSAAVIPADATMTAVIAARSPGVIAGLALVTATFAALDPAVGVELFASDGELVAGGKVLARLEGPARAVLAGERTALNFLGHLSGVATATAELAEAIRHTGAKIACTRKTTPGLRALEKYAVRCGGGVNHRFGLDDAVLIKDNHIAVAGGVALAIERARSAVGHLVMIEVEVDTLEQLEEALTADPDAVLLDNMTPEQLAEAVALVDGAAIVEASGGVTHETVVAIAEAGVDIISSGWITHSAPVLDVGLDVIGEVEPEPEPEPEPQRRRPRDSSDGRIIRRANLTPPAKPRGRTPR